MSRRALLVLLLLAAAQPFAGFGARAHLASDSYLRLDIGSDRRVHGEWDIALRDLDAVIGLDSDADGSITWGELRAKRDAVEGYAFARLSLASGGAACEFAPRNFLVDYHAGLAYAAIAFDAACPPATGKLRLGYHLLFDIDPTHRGLLTVSAGGRVQTAILSPQAAAFTIDPAAASRFAEAGRFLQFGFDHILLGYDHLLFVGVLLITAALRRDRDGSWVPIAGLGRVVLETLRVLTAFTLAHATTLTAAVLHLIEAPARLVDPAVAVTIMLAAADNIRPLLWRARWGIAFSFGLIHGLSFASALGPMQLPPLDLATALGCFNLGVEGGQIALALLVVPIVFLLRVEAVYPRLLAPLLSAAAFSLAGLWLVDRVFGLEVIALRPTAMLLSLPR